MDIMRRAGLIMSAAYLCGAFALAGCEQTRLQTTAQDSTDPIVISIDAPDPETKLTKTMFAVHIMDRDGHKPTTGATVAIDLVMPTMEMPKTTVECRQVSPGYYTGTGTFSMPGDWQLNVTATKGATSTAAFPVHVR